MGLLDGRVAVVTGAGRGLGRAHVLALAAEGASVLVNDVAGADETVATVAAVGGTAVTDDSDLSTRAAGAALVERALAEWGRVDVVVNNAGVSRPTPIAELGDESLALHLGVHLFATIGTTQAALRHMGRGGRVVNTVSGHGLEPRHPDSAAYATAKAAVFGFTRAAALEAAPLGITVNAVAPLAFTDMSAAYLSTVEGAEERFDPAHVARVVVFLASEHGADLNGRVLRVEGTRLGAYDVRAGALVETEGWTMAELEERMGEVLRA